MSDTPRTDAVASDGVVGASVCVPVEFAQELERELNKAQAKLAQYMAVVEAILNE